MTLTRRSVVAAGLTVPFAALAACGSDKSSTTDGAAGSSSATSAFPVTIKHKFGSTTVTKAPKRVVCVGLVEQDMLLALGIVPVAVTKWLDGAPNEIYPWAKDKLGSATPPVVLSDADGIQVEKIAALRPDLIIGQYAGLKAADYTTLSKLAPTIAQPAGYNDYGAPWDTSAQTVGDAVGKPEQARSIIAAVKAEFAKARQQHPEFTGKTALVTTLYEGIYIYGPQDPRSQVLQDLGLAFPERYKNIGGSSFGASVSAERTADTAMDVNVWLDGEANVDKATGGLWGRTSSAKQGRAIYISQTQDDAEHDTYAAAFSMVTPLSLPWLLKSYVPQLAAAVDGNPATKVPGPQA